MSNPINLVLKSLNQQLCQAFEIFQLLQLELGQDIANDFIEPSTVFYVSFGKDDCIDLFRSNSANSPRSDAKTLSRCVPRFVHSTNDSKGGSQVGGDNEDGVVCAPEINNFVLEYNAFLEQRVVARL
nr:SGNH hydrolase-type esterase domain-containing protein [Tanacetum cinerariifolium]